MPQDIRWVRRFNNYNKALNSLRGDVSLAKSKPLSDIEKRGLIQAFEYTYELAWNTIKDFYEALGEANIQGSRDAFHLAFRRGLVSNKHIIETIKSRQLTVHTYNEAIADDIIHEIIDKYYPAFDELYNNLLKQQQSRNN